MQFRRFFTSSALFVSPVLVWMLVVVLVDPFNYFNYSHLFSDSAKIQNAAALNTLVFNMLKEKHDPCENLIIGDSRAEGLPLDEIKRVTGLPYFLLTANALKLNESIDLFYFANRIKPVKRAVFTLNFNEFNEYAYADRVTSVEAMIANPLLYVFDRNVAEAGYHVVKASLVGKKSVNSVPSMSRETFWDFMVSVRAREHYERYRYPEVLYGRMRDLAAFATKQGTEVTFVIVPHHVDFQKRVREFGLVEDYLRFKRDLSRLGVRVIDYDYLNAMTVDQSDFRDPIHCNDEIGKLIVNEVFHGPLVKGRLLDAAWAGQCSKFLF